MHQYFYLQCKAIANATEMYHFCSCAVKSCLCYYISSKLPYGFQRLMLSGCTRKPILWSLYSFSDWHAFSKSIQCLRHNNKKIAQTQDSSWSQLTSATVGQSSKCVFLIMGNHSNKSAFKYSVIDNQVTSFNTGTAYMFKWCLMISCKYGLLLLLTLTHD